MTASSSAVDQLAEDFWERFLELSPVSATIIGDHRFDDRLPDPGPAGRARARSSRDVACATRRMAIPDDGLSVEDRITRDMLRVVGEVFIEDDDQRIDTLQVVDQMAGPQTILPQLTPVPAGRRPGAASRRSSPACAPIRPTWPPTASSSARRSRAA